MDSWETECKKCPISSEFPITKSNRLVGIPILLPAQARLNSHKYEEPKI